MLLNSATRDCGGPA